MALPPGHSPGSKYNRSAFGGVEWLSSASLRGHRANMVWWQSMIGEQSTQGKACNPVMLSRVDSRSGKDSMPFWTNYTCSGQWLCSCPSVDTCCGVNQPLACLLMHNSCTSVHCALPPCLLALLPPTEPVRPCRTTRPETSYCPTQPGYPMLSTAKEILGSMAVRGAQGTHFPSCLCTV